VVRLFRINGLLAAEGEALTRPTGQSTARWQVLASVEDAPVTVAQIARILGLARQSVQRVADALESGGLVRYEENPRHRRAKLVALTDEGKAVLGRIQAAQRPWADALGAAIGERQLRQANTLLDRVLAKMAAHPTTGERSEADAGEA
jgi:DNA-binding MarR family transcriptional regulator